MGRVTADRPAGLPDDLPILEFGHAAAMETWLEENADDAPGVWLKVAKKGTEPPTVKMPEAVDLALCFGWIDGQRRALDDRHFLQRFTPRRRRSVWSQKNVERVGELEAEGRIRDRGRVEIDAAKADGRWEAAYPRQSDAAPPPDLLAALDADPAVRAAFDALSSQNRFAIIYRVLDAKRPETRARRIETFVDMVRRGETLH